MANAVSVLSVGIVGTMHRRWFVANNAQSGQSELGSLAVETCIRWRAPSRAPRGSGAGNRQTRSVEIPCVRYLRSVACRTEARSAAHCKGNLIRDTHVRHGSRFALAWEPVYLRRRCPESPTRPRRPASAIANRFPRNRFRGSDSRIRFPFFRRQNTSLAGN